MEIYILPIKQLQRTCAKVDLSNVLIKIHTRPISRVGIIIILITSRSAVRPRNNERNVIKKLWHKLVVRANSVQL